ncbi:16S rRNA (cytidine(1402)-2'-O)-methyltransferase [Marinobacter salinisoli]|uniref:Ribosomal RNA small subunit methyltransferase I n=1 Tax=Marinobacter salinisoli TaxID=2769486 RepID=A0ABX7MVF6_9GAMM|nr:16S rRNA (cytidine(1402)-2'-O)-methyltransferase [Marinobacter salinisoli]QSP96158.1 16S rRNA (cytidine(1402)-2'-O)-methyltransferase [Marinobacter salinisoli]
MSSKAERPEKQAAQAQGTLYIVATPIGNLDDLSPRATRTLASVDVVAAEDTRHSGRLLQHLGIQKRMIALHDHNEKDRAEALISYLDKGHDVALISDAGTPLISDPGYVLVRIARERGFRVSPVPGPCALVAALSAAGLPTDRFLFAGFLPAKRSGRRSALDALRRETATLVFYESPHRIMDAVSDMEAVFGEARELVLGRELTKTFETFYAGSITEVRQQLEVDPHGSRGEFVVMVRGAESAAAAGAESALDVDRLLQLLLPELPVKKVAKVVAELSGQSKNELYQRALELKDD